MTLYDYDSYDGEYFGGSVLDFISEFKIAEKDGEIVLEKYNGSSEFVEIPENITVIGFKAFADCKLEAIDFPESVKRIEDYAFMNCGEIEYLQLPSNLQVIGNDVFENTEVSDIVIPDSIIDCSDKLVLKFLTSNKNYQYLNNFYYNNLKKAIVHGQFAVKTSSYELPNGFTAIGSNVFSSSQTLSKIKLPETLEYIGNRAFAYCENLREINFPKSLKHIGKSAFFETFLSKIDLGNCEDLKVIPDFCFTNNKIVQEVILPYGITRIGEDAFFGCENLNFVNLEECEELRIIDKTAFDNCDLIKVQFPEGNLFAICNSAFASNKNLTEIELPDSLRFMASNAFAHTGLEYIAVPYKTKVSVEIGTANDKKIYVKD